MNLDNYLKTMQGYADVICRVIKPKDCLIVPHVIITGDTDGWSVEIVYQSIREYGYLVFCDVDLKEMIKQSKVFYKQCSKESRNIERKLLELGGDYSLDFDGDTQCAIYYNDDWLIDVEGEDTLETLRSVLEILKSKELEDMIEALNE